jgi:hypothetical protein
MPRRRRTKPPRAPAEPAVTGRALGPVSIARVAELVASPFEFEFEDASLSDEHRCAIYVVRMCMIDVLGANAPTTHVVYDEKSGECAALAVHPSLARTVRDKLGIDPEDDRNEDDVEPIHCAMRINPLEYTDAIVLFFVRSAAWEWVESWCGAHGRSPARLLRKVLEDARSETSMSFDGGWGYGWGNLLLGMPSSVCARCGRPGTRACLGEFCVDRYCSRECQKAHWPVHKALCQFRPPCATMARVDAGEFIAFLAGDDRGDGFCREVLTAKPPGSSNACVELFE